MTSEEFHRRLGERAEEAGLQLSASIALKLDAYYQLLCTWNRRINLTALDLEQFPPEAVDRLLIEPLAAAQHARSHVAVLDIGSGGGSPAIPFALASEARELTMVESRNRKGVFLREAAYAVGLPARVMTSRFKDVINTEELAGHFGVVTIRAVRLADEDWVGLRTLLAVDGLALLLHQLDSGPEIPDGFRLVGRHRLTEKAELSLLRIQNDVPRGTAA